MLQLSVMTSQGKFSVLPQVVVVVTSRWDVLCFDHNLRLMWIGKVKVSCAFPPPHTPKSSCRHIHPSGSNHQKCLRPFKGGRHISK